MTSCGQRVSEKNSSNRSPAHQQESSLLRPAQTARKAQKLHTEGLFQTQKWLAPICVPKGSISALAASDASATFRSAVSSCVSFCAGIVALTDQNEGDQKVSRQQNARLAGFQENQVVTVGSRVKDLECTAVVWLPGCVQIVDRRDQPAVSVRVINVPDLHTNTLSMSTDNHKAQRVWNLRSGCPRPGSMSPSRCSVPPADPPALLTCHRRARPACPRRSGTC